MARWFEKSWFQKLLGVSFRDAAETLAPAASPAQIDVIFTAQDLKAMELAPASVHIQDLRKIVDPVLDAVGLRLIREKGLSERQLCLRGWRTLGHHLDHAISAVSVDQTKNEMRDLREAISTITTEIEKSHDGAFVDIPQNTMDTLATHYFRLQTGAVALELKNPAINKPIKLGLAPDPDRVAWSVLMAAKTGFINYYRAENQRRTLLAEDQPATQRYTSHE
jgi:hypothetical protein